MKSRHVLRAVSTAGLVAALVVPTAALADTFKHTDATKDVQKVTSDNKVTNVPDNTRADVVHLAVAHTAKQVRTTVRVRDLGRSWTFVEDVKTADKSFQLFGSRTSGHTSWTLAKGNGSSLSCDGLVGTQDRSANTVTVTVPETCLGDPHWVRVGVGFVVTGKGGAFFADDSQRTRHAGEANLTLSPKIRRG